MTGFRLMSDFTTFANSSTSGAVWMHLSYHCFITAFVRDLNSTTVSRTKTTLVLGMLVCKVEVSATAGILFVCAYVTAHIVTLLVVAWVGVTTAELAIRTDILVVTILGTHVIAGLRPVNSLTSSTLCRPLNEM